MTTSLHGRMIYLALHSFPELNCRGMGSVAAPSAVAGRVGAIDGGESGIDLLEGS